jgi:MerR family transcriptional regulator/heat shock protein HspR
MPKPILTISQVAARFGISVRTIRVYEEEGFISVERYGRRCLLRPVDVEAIAMIQRLKTDLGVNLAGIGIILEMRRQIEALRERLLDMDGEG